MMTMLMTIIFLFVNIHVAGVTYDNRDGVNRQQRLQELQQHMKGAYVTLHMEPNNKADPNAIKVIAHCPEIRSHFQIGYVPRDKAHYVARAVDRDQIVRTSGLRVVGGGEGKNYGCYFDLVMAIA